MNRMKPVVLLAIFVSFFSVISVADSEAQLYVGDYCWSFSGTSGSSSGVMGSVQLGFLWVGGWHFMVSGVIRVTSPVVMEFPAYGNYEAVGSYWNLTLTAPGRRDGSLGIDLFQAVLDPITASGTAEWIGVYGDAIESSAGIMTFTACQ